MVSNIKVATMASKVGQLKPFMIEEKKEGPTRSVSETTANKWQRCMIANIKKEEKWIPFLSPKTWKVKKVATRGFTGDEAAANTTQVDALLEYVSQYAPTPFTETLPSEPPALTLFGLLLETGQDSKHLGANNNPISQ